MSVETLTPPYTGYESEAKHEDRKEESEYTYEEGKNYWNPLVTLSKILPSPIESERHNQARNFVTNELLTHNIKQVDGELFIYGELLPYFTIALSSQISKSIMKYYKDEQKEKKKEQNNKSKKRGFDIDKEFEGLYKIETDKEGNPKGITIFPDEIAYRVIKNLHVISYTGNLFSYKDGCFRNDPIPVKAEVMRILLGILHKEESNGISSYMNDIMNALTIHSPIYNYPFNDYRNALPVENGILIFDFENKECKLIDPDPANYKFNYKIPVKYDRDLSNTVIYDMLNDYNGNARQLIQIPAQSFMQAMRRGPYKRAYMIYGKKNAGKTIFVDLLEWLVGEHGHCDVSLEQINQRFQKASFEGKLLNIHDDMGYFTVSETGTFKTFTGKPMHTIEKKGVQQYTAFIGAVHVMTTNLPAKFDSRVKTDDAFWERWEFITFNKTFGMNGSFKDGIFTPENMTAFLNYIIEEMLIIGHNGKLSTDVDWYETREKWMLAGNPLYGMIKELMDPVILDVDLDDKTYSKETKGTAIIKEQMLTRLQKWCISKGMDKRVIPDSTKDLTKLAEACGWETEIRKNFDDEKDKEGNPIFRHCYIIPHTWKKGNSDVLKYNIGLKELTKKQVTTANY